MLEENGELHGWWVRSKAEELKRLDRYNVVKVGKIVERLTGQYDPKKASPFALVVASYVLKFNHSTQDSLKLCDKIMAVQFWRHQIGKKEKEE